MPLLATSMAASSLFAATACGPSLPPPRERLVTTETEISEAEKLGAEKVTKSKEILARVRASVARAKLAMKEGKNAEAEQLLVRAEADAELAGALAKEGVLAEEVARAKARLEEEEKKAK